MRTHPDIVLMTARQQACSRLTVTFAFVAVYSFASSASHSHQMTHEFTNYIVSGGELDPMFSCQYSLWGREFDVPSTRYLTILKLITFEFRAPPV